MSRYAFEPAGPADDAALRRRLATDRMPGTIAITFRREPDYFAGLHLQGRSTEVIKCTDRQTGTIVGMAARSLSLRRLDGEPLEVAYLSDLRGDERHRGGTLLARGFRHLQASHRGHPTALSFAVIYEGNEPARRLLTSGRAGLPSLRQVDRLLTPAIHLDVPRSPLRIDGLELRRARPDERAQIVALLAREWRRKQLAPADPDAELADGAMRTVSITDFFVAARGAEIVGCLAAWDQSRLRQTHVEAYGGPLRWLRPLYNAIAAVSPLKPLPAPSRPIPYLYLGLVAIDRNDPVVLAALLRHAYNALRRGPWSYAILGLCESDPLSTVLRGYRRIAAAGLVHTVRFDGDPPDAFDRLAAGGPIYLEAGCL